MFKIERQPDRKKRQNERKHENKKTGLPTHMEIQIRTFARSILSLQISSNIVLSTAVFAL